ncbi:hypothetical protein DIRU0_B11562 [Diutina rugosa]
MSPYKASSPLSSYSLMYRLPYEVIHQITSNLAIDDLLHLLDAIDHHPHWTQVYRFICGTTRVVRGPKALRHLTNVTYKVTTANDNDVTYPGITYLEVLHPQSAPVIPAHKVISAWVVHNLTPLCFYPRLRQVDIKGGCGVDLRSVHTLEQVNARYVSGELQLSASVSDVTLVSCDVSVAFPPHLRTLKCVGVHFHQVEISADLRLEKLVWKDVNFPLTITADVVDSDQPPIEDVRYKEYRYSPSLKFSGHIDASKWQTQALTVYDTVFTSICLPQNLESLSLDGCRLSTIPPLSNSIRHLSVRNNNLTSIQLDCYQLKSLDVSMNDLTTLTNLPLPLEVLVAAFNVITEIEIPPRVHTLDLTGNRLIKCDIPYHVTHFQL